MTATKLQRPTWRPGGKKIIKILVIIFALGAMLHYISTLSPAEISVGKVVINEVCPKNFSLCSIKDGSYFPRFYVELYNPGTEPLDLDGYRICTPFTGFGENVIRDTVLGPGEFLVLYGDERDRAHKHKADIFNIEDGVSKIVLLSGNDLVIERLELPQLPVDTVYSRKSDGTGEFYPMEATPGASNNNALQVEASIKAAPVFSRESGFYPESFNLEITTQSIEDRVYYTLDGSRPDLNSPVYTGAVLVEDASPKDNIGASRRDTTALDYYVPDYPVDKGTIVRAVSYDSQGNRSQEAKAIFFVDGVSRLKEKYCSDIPVVSITTEPDNLWGYSQGMMILGETFDNFKEKNGGVVERKENYRIEANFNNKDRQWEKPVSVDVFEEGKLVFSQEAGLKNRGKSGSEGPQKSFSLNARGIYGNNSFQYDFTGTGRKCSQIILKKSSGFSMRDALVYELVKGKRMPYAHSKEYNLFLNGEYWGLYSFVERFDEDHFLWTYKIPENKTTYIKNEVVEIGDEDAIDSFLDCIEFAEDMDLSIDINYKEFCNKVDIKSVMEYYAINIFIDNEDTQDFYNMATWKSDNRNISNSWADGKWHFMLYDLDYSMLYYWKNNITREIRTGRTSFFEHRVMAACLENESFRRDFKKTILDLMDKELSPQRAQRILDDKKERLFDALVYDKMRFNDMDRQQARSAVTREFDHLSEFFRYRKAFVLDNLKKAGV